MKGRRALGLAAVGAALALASPSVAGGQSLEPRIVGGSSASIANYPWQGAVAYSEAQFPSANAFQRQFCGGSLVTASIVITAAHCVADGDPDCNVDGGSTCNPSDPGGDGTKRIDPNDVSVVLGRTTLTNTGTGAEHPVRDVSFHPGFDPDTFANDVGYLVLQTPSAQQTIDIAGSDEAAVWAPGTLAEITGWGSTGGSNNGVDSLRKASVPIVSDATCGSGAVYGSEFDPATMVCAGYPEGGVDTCSGDSGGPMQSPLAGGGYRLTGVTSWGIGCARPNRPGVYARIAGAALRSAAGAAVQALETTYSLPHENIVGSGAQPANDDDPPDTTITSGPAGTTSDATPTFGFSSDEQGSSFECRFDAAEFALCSGPGATHTPSSPLGSGAHTFHVRAIDLADNVDPLPASRTFTVSTESQPPPPTTTPVPTPTPTPTSTAPAPTGERAAALKKCKKKKTRTARRKCRKRARRLPV